MEGNRFLFPTENNFRGPATARAPPHWPLTVPVGHVVFRILCLESQVSGMIGKSGNVIQQLQTSTSSKIRIEEAPIDSLYRVITIIAQGGSTSKVKLGVNNREKEEQEEEEVKVSKAQEALIRVFEVLNVELRRSSTVVSCRLLAEFEYSRALIVNRGKIVERLTEKTGCKVDIRTADLPICADPDDAMVEIEGNVLAVKKALVSISRFLQAYQPTNKTRVLGSTSLQASLPRPSGRLRTDDKFSHGTLLRSSDVTPHDPRHRQIEMFHPVELFPPDAPQDLSQPRKDFLSQRNSDPLSTIKQPLSASEDDNRELVLKILCSTESDLFLDLRLLSQTDVSISLGDTVVDCDERLITITASENPKDQFSPARQAIDRVFITLHDIAVRYRRSSVTARLVVRTNQIGCLLGEGGSNISEMGEISETSIQILKVEQNPKCVSENDRVVQISGQLFDVRDAINLVTRRLRDDLFFPSKTNSATESNATFIAERISHGETLNPVSMGFQPSEDSFQRGSHYSVDTDSFSFGRRSTMDLNDISPHSSQAPSPPWASPPPAAPRGVYDGSGGLSSTRADLGIDSGLKSPIVTKTTVEIRVPENAVNFVCGYEEDGHNLVQDLRQITGARVIVQEPRQGARDMIITISGTPDQTQVAEKLLRTSILTGESLSWVQTLKKMSI